MVEVFQPLAVRRRQGGRVWCREVPVGLARGLRGALSTQAGALSRSCAPSRLRHGA